MAKILLVSYFRDSWDTQQRVWFNLKRFLPYEKDIILVYNPSLVQFEEVFTLWKRHNIKIRYSQNSQITVWNRNFFPASYSKRSFFWLLVYVGYSIPTWSNLKKFLSLLHTDFAPIWINFWAYEADLIRKPLLAKFSYFCVCKPNFVFPASCSKSSSF